MLLTNIMLVAIGGAFGSSFRYLLSDYIILSYLRGLAFPFSTIIVNVLGSFLAGILHFIFINYFEQLSMSTRLMLMTGFLGGFTTFSAFSLDVLRLISAGHFNMAISYTILSVILSIIAIFIGFYLSSMIVDA